MWRSRGAASSPKISELVAGTIAQGRQVELDGAAHPLQVLAADARPGGGQGARGALAGGVDVAVDGLEAGAVAEHDVEAVELDRRPGRRALRRG